MSIPRFTAAASIYKTIGHYRMGATSNKGGPLVHPALLNIPIERWCGGLNWECYFYCTEANRCVTPTCQQNCINQCTYHFPCSGPGPIPISIGG
jgi:hypothetical protein